MATIDASFERAYTQHLSAVSGFLYRRVEQRFVEDLAADVFAIAWRRRASVAPGEELPWLYRIAANVVSNHRRKQATGNALIAALRPADSAPSAEDLVIADATLASAWRQLRPAEREVPFCIQGFWSEEALPALSLNKCPHAPHCLLCRFRTDTNPLNSFFVLFEEPLYAPERIADLDTVDAANELEKRPSLVGKVRMYDAKRCAYRTKSLYQRYLARVDARRPVVEYPFKGLCLLE